MTEEFIHERERDLLDYIRNNLTDPELRSSYVEEEHTATAGQTEFVLSNKLVKNVAEWITVDGTSIRKGYQFKVDYGEGNANTKVILSTAAAENDEVVIPYHHGPSLVEREYARTDTKLPRVIMAFLLAEEEFAGLGDLMEDGKGSYINVSYRFEIRDLYANRARRITSEVFNLIRKLRQESLFRVNITRAGGLQNFDYDIEKGAYVWQFTADIQWEILYE